MTTLTIGLLTVLAAVAQVPERPARPAARASEDPAFAEAEASYQTALRAYDAARIEAARGRAPAPTAHPARAAWPRMEALAQGGSVPARQWLCQNVGDGVLDPAQRLATLERETEALLACCAGDLVLLTPIAAFRTQAALIGPERAVQNLDRIADRATNPEVQARALIDESFVVSDRGRTTDPAKRAAAAELQRSVVLGLPTTSAARDAAELLDRDVQRELVAAFGAWLQAAAAMQTAGRPATEWPPNPLHEFRARFEMLATTRLDSAKRWVEVLYPSFVQGEKLGPALGLSTLAADLGRHYAPRDPDWGPLRMRALALAVRVAGGDAPWIAPAATAIAASVADLPPLAPLPFTQAVLELVHGSEARAQALWIDASTRIPEGSDAELVRALESLDAIVAKHPDMAGLAEQAAAKAALLRQVVPGATLPDTRTSEWTLRDSDDLELVLSGYRGRVLLIDVFDAAEAAYAELVPGRIALEKQLAGRPFAIVGLCRSRATLPAAREGFAKLGIDWRCGMLQGAGHPYLATLFARPNGPTTILVDAQGVIRARNRPAAELARLATELTAEAERAASGK